jgi:hypothetical protein
MSSGDQSDTMLLETFVDALLTGKLTAEDLAPVPKRTLGACWRWAVFALCRGPNDPRLVAAITELTRVDPEFPLGQYLLGLACRKVGRLEDAREAFEKQARHPSGPHAARGVEMLKLFELS